MGKITSGIVLGILSLFFTVPVFAVSDNYNKAWAAFNNNDRTKARAFFESVVESGKDSRSDAQKDSRNDALLSLALLDWSELKDSTAFSNFKKFYDNSDNPYPYLYAMFSLPFMNPDKILTNDQLAFFEEIVGNPKLEGTLKAMILQKIGDYYQDINNLKKANELYDQMGALNKWQVLGSFDNISGSGFDKDWGAVKNATTESVFKNSVNADVKWYTPSANKWNNWFYLDYYFQLKGVIMYAQTFVDSPADLESYIRVGTSGSLKIWINDALVSSIPEERNCDLDIYAYKIHLNKGANRILVQIGQSEISAANFLIRLTDFDGDPMPGLSQSAVYSNYTKSTAQPTNEILPFFAEEYFEEKIKENPSDLLNYLLLAEIYLRNDKSYEGISILKKAEQLAPKSSFVSYRQSEAYMRARNQTNYSREIENIKKNDPDSYVSMKEVFDDALSTENYTEAEATIKKAKSLYGTSLYTDAMDIQLVSAQKKMDELIQAGKDLYAKYPYNYEYMNLYYSIEDNVYKNTKGATEVLENYCAKYFDTRALESLANRYLKLGETDKGLKTFEERNEKSPYASGYLYSYATLLQSMQKYSEALTVLKEVKKLSPYASYVYNTEGYVYKGLKDDGNAKESFKKAIYYDPTSYDSRMQLRLLDNKKEMFDLFPKVDIDALIQKAPSAKDYPEESAVIILNDNQLVFYPEGAQEHRAEIAIKILNQSGIEDWKEYGIGYNGNNQKLILNKYEVIKANGQKIKAETDNAGRIVFTNLEVGDVLHLDYRLQDFYTGVLSKHFFDYSLMQYSMPSVYNRYAILVPKDKDFKYKVTNGDIKPVISEVENMKLYQWVNKDVPAIKDEPFMSPLVDTCPMVAFSSIPDWKFVSDWYRDLTTNKIGDNSDYILNETYKEILTGKENAGSLEKAKLFYEYILKNITYSNVSFMQSNFVPQKASRTITTRLGDCKDVSTLFVALCRKAGIKANLVLISTRENGINSMVLPTNGFNHCIARLDVDGKIYNLELTDNYLPFGAAVDSDLQSNILPIPYKDEALGEQLLQMDMPFRMKNAIKRKAEITVEDNDMRMNLSSARLGQLASYSRHMYADVGAEDRLKDVNQIYASEWNIPVKVSNLVFKNLDNLTDSVYTSLNLEVKGVLQDVAGMKIFKMPWSDAIKSLSVVSLEARKYPLEFWSYLYCDSEQEQIDIILPKGKSFVEMPKNVKLECPVATYEMTFETNQSGGVTARRIFTKKKDTVSTQEYSEFRNFINSVSECDNKQYAIK